MASESSSPGHRNGLVDVIMTLPVPAIAAMALVLIAGLGACGWALVDGRDNLRELAKQIIVVELPLLVAVIAAIGIRRSSSREIDRLVGKFLDDVIFQRLVVACRDQASSGYPFKAVRLEKPSNGRSYAYYQLDWAGDQTREPARLGVKMNIFNIEVLVDLPVARLPDGMKLDSGSATRLIDRDNLDTLAADPLLRLFPLVIQGSVQEGYAVRLVAYPAPAGGYVLRLSLRQKLSENILSSPYLKRYFAEDIAIVNQCIFEEWLNSGLLAAPQTVAVTPS
jgi:hypothetical protein